jgi:hypothetical protein
VNEKSGGTNLMAKHRRGRSTTSSAPAANAAVDLLPLSLPDVYLLTAVSDGREAVAGLTVVINHEGFTVVTPHQTIAAVITWPELTVLRTAGRTKGPAGEDAVLLEASGAARAHRFVVPTADPVALEATIAEITGITPSESPRRSRRGR